MTWGPIFPYTLIYQQRADPPLQPVCPVVFDAQASASITGLATTSFTNSTNLTVGVGNKRALLVQIAWNGSTVTPAVTWNGVSLTQLVTQTATDSTTKVAIFGMINPDPGTLTLAGSWGNSRDFVVNAVAYSNVLTTSIGAAFPRTSTGQTAASPATTTVVSALGNAVVAVHAAGDGTSGSTFSAVNNTQVFRTVSGGAGSAGNRAIGASSVTMTGTYGIATNSCSVAVDVQAAPCPLPQDIRWFPPFSDPVRGQNLFTPRQQFFAGSLFPIVSNVVPYAGWDDTLEWPRPIQPTSPAYSAPFIAFVPLAREDIAKLEWTTLWQDPVRIKPAALQLPFPAQPFSVFQVRDNPVGEWINWPDFAPGRPILRLYQPWTFIPIPRQVFFPYAPWDDFTRHKPQPLDTQPLIWTPQTLVVSANILWYQPWSVVTVQNIMIGEG